MNSTTFPILFENESLVAINKPTGILVHRTKISEDTIFVLQLLRKQLKQRVYPIHRLDRATSGILVFGKNPEAAALLSEQMRLQKIEKAYLAIVRGYVEEKGTIDYPLAPEPHLEKQAAITHFDRLAQVEIPEAVGRYATARYSLLRIHTETGRRHQIRRQEVVSLPKPNLSFAWPWQCHFITWATLSLDPSRWRCSLPRRPSCSRA